MHFLHRQISFLHECRKNAVLKIRKIRRENLSMEKCIKRSDNEELLNYSNDEEKSEGGYMNDNVSSAVNKRKVMPPKVKWQTQNYHSIINWTNELMTESLNIASQSSQQASDIIKTPLVVRKWPNHTQAVEREIKVMNEDDILGKN